MPQPRSGSNSPSPTSPDGEHQLVLGAGLCGGGRRGRVRSGAGRQGQGGHGHQTGEGG
ncbi:hypothetical protein QP028_07200 [Corynebacterium suedekumii]|nr:hypothetical protein QP028_07200 [Corynebacterium suedekumii]